MLYRMLYCLMLACCLASCAPEETKEHTTTTDTGTVITEEGPPIEEFTPVNRTETYQNDAFREVRVAQTAQNEFLITGQARIFEATIDWVIEDGHNELKSGFTTADKGAPEWGNFRIPVDVPADDPNTTLQIILYETSAKDGSRIHDLVIPLY